MSAPEADAWAVIQHFQQMLGSDGCLVQLHSVEGPVLKVRYQPGDCDDCVLAPEDLAGMMEELLARKGSAITRVQLVEQTQQRMF